MLKKKTKPVKSETLDLLLQNFAGELVQIILNKDITHVKETEEGMESLTSSLSATGFLTDVDEKFLYVGYEVGGMHQAINRDFIIHIELAEESDIQTLMDQPEKKNPGSYN